MPIKSASTSVGRIFFRATFGDIWGHLGTYVPLARPAPPGNALPGASRKSMADSEPLHATEHARKQSKNGDQRQPNRDRTSTRKTFLLVDISRLWSTLVDFCRPKPPARSRTGTSRAWNAYWLPNSNTSPFTRSNNPSPHATCSVAYVTLTRSGTARCRRLRSMKCSGHVQRERACTLLEWLL